MGSLIRVFAISCDHVGSAPCPGWTGISKKFGAFGICMAMAPMLPRDTLAAAADQATYFTCGGWDLPELYADDVNKHGESPNFATFGGSEEAFTKMKADFVVDVAHTCNVEIPRWIESGLFQPLDTSKLSNWPQAHAKMREAKAERGWAVICAEECMIHPTSDYSAEPQARLWDDHDTECLALMVEAVHRHEALSGVRLAHNGVGAQNLFTRLPPIGPSDQAAVINVPSQTRGMTRRDIREFRCWHRTAALRARQLPPNLLLWGAGRLDWRRPCTRSTGLRGHACRGENGPRRARFPGKSIARPRRLATCV